MCIVCNQWVKERDKLYNVIFDNREDVENHHKYGQALE